MCAGSAQVTFAELRRSYCTGRNPKGETNTKQPKKTPNQKPSAKVFSHGYGRYVCREAQVTLDEFEESDERIRARTKEAKPPRPKQQNKQAHINNPPKETENGAGSYRLKCEKKVKTETKHQSNTKPNHKTTKGRKQPVAQLMWPSKPQEKSRQGH